MERLWSLVAVLLLAVQARGNPWTFGENHPNFMNIFQINGHILPFTYNTRQIITIPPCMSLKHVWVKVANTFGFTPTVKFHKSLNVVSITYGLLQYTGSDYSIVARGFRTPKCVPGVHQPDNEYFPYRLKGQNSYHSGRPQKMRHVGGKKIILQRKGKDFKEILEPGNGENGVATDGYGYDSDFKDKNNGYENDWDDKYDFLKESYEDMSELKEVGSGKKRNYLIFLIADKNVGQYASEDNDGDVGYDRNYQNGDDDDDFDLDYLNRKHKYKSSRYMGLGEYSGSKEQTKSGGYDRAKENKNRDSYRDSDNRYSKKKVYSEGSELKRDDRNSFTSRYNEKKLHTKDKISVENDRYEGNLYKNYKGGSYDEDSGSNKYIKNKYSVGNDKGSGYEDTSIYENYKDGIYGGDIRYVDTKGYANNKGYDGNYKLDEDYLDGFGIDNKDQLDGREKDIRLLCSDYLRTNPAADKKVINYCLLHVGRSD